MSPASPGSWQHHQLWTSVDKSHFWPLGVLCAPDQCRHLLGFWLSLRLARKQTVFKTKSTKNRNIITAKYGFWNTQLRKLYVYFFFLNFGNNLPNNCQIRCFSMCRSYVLVLVVLFNYSFFYIRVALHISGPAFIGTADAGRLNPNMQLCNHKPLSCWINYYRHIPIEAERNLLRFGFIVRRIGTAEMTSV